MGVALVNRIAWLALLLATLGSGAVAQDRAVPAGVWVRDGYELTVAEATIDGPRFMAFGEGGELYVSLPTAGQIRACRDRDGDGYFETVTTYIERKPSVHGLCWHDGWLWFTTSGAIFRARDTDGDGRADDTETVIAEGKLPMGGGHWWRSILIHGDRLYTSIGDASNISDQTDTKRQKILTYDLTGGDERLFCAGIRNTEKLVNRPGTDEIWGMDHGSDWFGGVIERRDEGKRHPITDRQPPCEMNHYVEGGFYGHPFVVGDRLPRYEFMDREDIVELAAKTIAPRWETGAHWAPNAMCFYTGARFPHATGDAFVAYHGSWNRSEKAGYCVTRVHFESGAPWGEQKCVSFLSRDGRQVWGRPVDVVVAPDGSLLISDDHGDRVYRLRYTGK